MLWGHWKSTVFDVIHKLRENISRNIDNISVEISKWQTGIYTLCRAEEIPSTILRIISSKEGKLFV